VGGVIKGWTEALQTHARRVQVATLSSRRAGLRRAGPKPEIGPNSTLVFEVELLSIQAKEKEKSSRDYRFQPKLRIEANPMTSACTAGSSPNPESQC